MTRDQWKPYAISEIDAEAAILVGLKPDELDGSEKLLFPFLVQTTANIYLSGRNFLLREWHHKYSDSLMTFSAAADLKINVTLDAYLLQKAYQFLDRYRYINYGVVRVSRNPRFDPNVTVIVIGAGLSGITAAREIYNIFQNQDILPRIIMFEARQRIGGRIFTFPLHCRWVDENISPCVDLGPSSIIDHVDTKHLLSQLGLELIPNNLFNFKDIQLYDLDGSIIAKDLFEKAQNFLFDVLEEVRKKCLKESDFKENEYLNAFDLLEQAIMDHKLYSRFHNCHLRIIYWHLMAFRFRNAIHSENIIKDVKSKNYFSVSGGLGQMTHGLAYGVHQDNNYSLDIHCGRMIEEVSVNESGKVEILCGESKFVGDYAVLAVPQSLNQKKGSVKDEEELITHQLVNKICMVFPRIFWPIETLYFGILSDHSLQSKGKYFLIQNMFHETKLPCLMIYCCGPGALDIESLDDLTIQKDILNILARIFPLECPLPYPIESIITRWTSDQYSGKLNPNAKEMKINASKDNCKLVWTESEESFISPKPGDAIKNGKKAARIIADKILGVIS